MSRFSKIQIAVFILILFYTVGLVGLSIPTLQPLFLQLTPFNLLLTLCVLAWANDSYTIPLFFASFLIFIIGYLVELAGVKTGALFGEYWYGNTLGAKFFEVPILIGVNWLLLVLGAHAIFKPMLKNKILLCFASSLLMVLLDVVIEPVAVRLDFWQWQDGIIPLQNFGMWFITALALQALLSVFPTTLKRELGVLLYAAQFLFFGFLNLLSQI